MPIFGPIGAGSSSTSTGINYIGNPDAESDVSGWSAYADAAASTPVDGTGGSPTVTITRTTTTPLRGTGSFLITKDAANRQGEGVSSAFTINSADKAKVLNISFDYEVPSGTFTAGDSSDLRVWVYDVTNSTLIGVAPYTIQGNGTIPNKFTGVFQTASNSTSYRLIIHCATTSASAYTFEFDNVAVGPQIQLYGAPIGDWQSISLTPNATAFGTISAGSYYGRRNGDSLEIIGSFIIGTATANPPKVALPSGYTIDTAKLNTTKRSVMGTVWVADDSTNTGFGSTDRIGACYAINTDTSNFYMAVGAASSNIRDVDANGGAANGGFSNADTLMFHLTVPISGWSSTVLMSNDTDTRVVAARLSGDPASATTTNPIIFPTADFDTHAAYSTSTGLYTVPVTGIYEMHGYMGSASAAGTTIKIYKNGSADIVTGISDVNGEVVYSGSIRCNAGDTISIRPVGATYDADSTSVLNIHRLSGPSAIAATETVAALYESNTARSITNGAATTGEFRMEDLIYDTHGAYNTSTAIYTAPVSGKYRVSASSAVSTGGGWAVTEQWGQQLFKNGTYNRSMGTWISEGTSTVNVSVNGTTVVSCVAGDTLEVRILQNSGGALSTNAVATDNWTSFERIGN